MLVFAKYIGVFVALIVAAIFLARMIFALPDISQRSRSTARPASKETRLGQRMFRANASHPGKSGVAPLSSGRDAFYSRLTMINAAEHTIDSQYYIWHDDTSGILLLAALHRAAQRGVRVRLLLDDNGVDGLDPFLAALNCIDNIEIRLFNPSSVRKVKLLGYAFDFLRMNRRMHNKSLIVDGAVAIVGGRNIGDEYFQVGDEVFFLDMDVLATGTIVSETAQLFDQYWNSTSAFQVENIISGPGDMPGFLARVAAIKSSRDATDLLEEAEIDIARYLPDLDDMEWTDVELVADDPLKGLGTARRDQLMITRLSEILGGVTERLDVVTAYLVPGVQGTRFFTDLAQNGVKLRILTNAMSSTDVLLVHAGYSKYRRKLLRAGISLFELKPFPGHAAGADQQILPFGLSGGSLHAKTFAIDNARIFIGSFNFDPRSAMLNCEMGFLIDSPSLARRLSQSFDTQLDTVSYRPALTPENKLIWHETNPDGTLNTYQEDPDATRLQQVSLALIGLLPIEWLL